MIVAKTQPFSSLIDVGMLQPSSGSLPLIKTPTLKNNIASSITSKDIAWLWMSMANAYGYKFISNYGDKDNGVWLEALKDFTRDDLVYGFNKMLMTITEEERERNESWPPNVKEFRMYCERRLKDFDLPEMHEAFQEMKNNNYFSRPRWSHPLLAVVKNCLGKKAQDYVTDEDYQSFSVIYHNLCQRFMHGEAMCLMQGVW